MLENLVWEIVKLSRINTKLVHFPSSRKRFTSALSPTLPENSQIDAINPWRIMAFIKGRFSLSPQKAYWKLPSIETAADVWHFYSFLSILASQWKAVN